MSDTVKLIIAIPDYEYRQIKEVYEKSDIVSSIYSYIYHGTPLDGVKSEIVALSNANPSYWHSGDMVEREEVLEILNNIGKESEEQVISRKVKADSIEVWKAEIVEREHIKELLDKIRTEIDQLPLVLLAGNYHIDKDSVMQILDKYKAESEDT